MIRGGIACVLEKSLSIMYSVRRGLIIVPSSVDGCLCGQSQEEEGPVEVSPFDDYVPGQLIVKFKSDVSVEERESVIEESGGESVIQTVGPEENKTYLVKLKPDVSVEKAMEDFESHDEVEYAEPNYMQTIQE